MRSNRASLTVSLLMTLGAATAAADPGDPVVLDKWGRCHTNITILENPTRTPEGTTNYNEFAWVPKIELVVQVVDPESDDVVIVQHYLGDTAWGDPLKLPAQNVTKRDGRDYSLVQVSGALDQKHAITDTGTFTVNVAYKQTGRGRLHENLATFRYTVKNCVRGWTSKGQIKGFYVDHDFRMGEAWLYRVSDGKLQLWTWFKYDRDGEEKVRNGRLRCYCGDTRFDFLENPTRRTVVSYENYTSQTAHEQVNWGLWYWSLPRIEGEMAADYLRKHPGEYRCVLTQDGDVSREFTFTVGADGEIVREPFAGSSAIHAVEDSFPLKMEFKQKVDLEFDDSAFETGRLYGRG